MSIVAIKNLSYFIGEAEILRDVSFEIQQGEIYGLLGANGSGKSTLIKIILGLVQPTAGEVKMLDESLADRSHLYHVGALIEKAALYGHLTSYQNLKINAVQLGVPEERIHEVLEIAGLSLHKQKKVKHFSVGMKQRLGIALAILHSPEFLILDEPTSGIDQEGIFQFHRLIETLNSKFKTTVLITSHILSDIEKLSTHIGVLREGRLIFNDTKSVFSFDAINEMNPA